MRSIVDSPALQGRVRYPVGCSPPKQGSVRDGGVGGKNNKGTNAQTTRINGGESVQQSKKNQQMVGQLRPKVFNYNILAVLGRGGYG